MRLSNAIRSLANNLKNIKDRYYLVYHDAKKPRLLIFMLSLETNPVISVEGTKGLRMYMIIRKSLKEVIGEIEEIPLDNTKCLILTPDIGEIVLAWVISQYTLRYLDEETLRGILKLGIPKTLVELRKELYKRSLKSNLRNGLNPVIRRSVIRKISREYRRLIDILIFQSLYI